jgi:hypothetical protein
VRWRSSRCPSLSCCALGDEQERIDEEWNGLSSMVSPSRVQPYPLYIEIGRVHGSLGGSAYSLHALESRRVLQQLSMDHGSVVKPKKPWTSSGWPILTQC